MNAYQAIADDNRRKILDLLRVNGPLRAGDIVIELPHISQPAVSKHLRFLRESGLISHEQQGRERWYRLNPASLVPVAQWLQQYEMLWEERLHTLKYLAEAQVREESNKQVNGKTHDNNNM